MNKRFQTPLFCIALASAAMLAACGGGGGGGGSTPPTLGSGGGGGSTTVTPTSAPQQTASTTTGIAYLSNAVDSTKAMQVVSYEDTTGAIMSKPVLQTLSTSSGSTLGQVVASSDYSVGAVMADGAGSLDMTKIEPVSLSGGTFASTGTALDLSTTAQAPLHSIAMFPDGGVMLVQGADEGNFYAVGGISTGSPSVLGAIPYPTPAPGNLAEVWHPHNIAVAPDGKSVTIRGSYDTKFYSVSTMPNSNGTTTYNFNLTGSIPSVASAGTLDGVGEMAYTKDGTGVIFGNLSTGSQLTLVTGLPATPTQGSTITLAPAGTIHAIAVAPSGSYAAVGSGAGLFIVSGISAGSLTQSGSNYAGTFTASDGSTQQVSNITAIGFSSDGKYIAAIANYVLGSGIAHDSLIVIPVDSTGTLGTIAACVNDVNPASSLSGDMALFR